MATLAVFVGLGGTSYAVATGAIGSREIKNNAVRSKDVRNNDLRGRDIRNSTVRGADTANTANTAGSADSADSLSSQTKIVYRAAGGAAAQTIYDGGKLRISAACTPGLRVTATTTVDNATIHSDGGDPPVGSGNAVDGDFDTGETAVLSDDFEARHFVYTEPGGQVVTVAYAGHRGKVYGAGDICIVKGLAQAL